MHSCSSRTLQIWFLEIKPELGKYLKVLKMHSPNRIFSCCLHGKHLKNLSLPMALYKVPPLVIVNETLLGPLKCSPPNCASDDVVITGRVKLMLDGMLCTEVSSKLFYSLTIMFFSPILSTKPQSCSSFSFTFVRDIPTFNSKG